MNMRFLPQALVCALLLLAASPAWAQVGWRGDGSGVYPNTTPPTQWSTTENILWETPMSAESNAIPVVVGDRVFVTAEPRTLMALNAMDGRLLWEREITFVDSQATGRREWMMKQREEALKLGEALIKEEQQLNILKGKARKARKNTDLMSALNAQSLKVNDMRAKLEKLQKFRPPESLPVVGSASSTPLASEDAVFAIFGNGVVARVSFSGTLIWARFLGKPMQPMLGYFRGQAASPRIAGGHLIVALNHLYALSLEDGSIQWKGEVYKDFGTPAIVDLGDKQVIVTPSGLVVDATDGAVLARDLARVFYASPITSGNRAYLVGAYEDHKMDRHFSAIEILTGPEGKLSARSLWNIRSDRGSNQASPLLVQGLLYSMDKDAKLMIFSADTGKLLSKKTLHKKMPASTRYYPSPAFAGGHIYITNNEGMTGVFKPGLDYEALSFNPLKPMRSSLVFVKDRIYVRTKESAFCIREQNP